MESLPRPPHRRKHSATTNAFSSSFPFKNPYDDVFLSTGGKRNSFEAHEYAEIFSGSSSIPVVDLSCLDERVGSGDCQSSKLDYSDIFGGLRNDDVAVPYDELLNGSAKKTKPRIPVDVSAWQESGSLHSSGKSKWSSGEASDQSVDGVKQQFNLSFNRTTQRNVSASNGKTHIAQLHAVPAFTYFVDGTPLRKTEDNGPLPSLKREVSRTWSFSAEVEADKGKGGLSCSKLHLPDKSHNMSEINLKSHSLKVPPPSSCPSDLSANKDPRRSSASNFGSKEDASKKIAVEHSPPFFDEEFDENSVAAVSVAALKKAIDQAQESIRMAKMIMERKKEGYQDGSKPRSSGHLKVLDKETKIDYEAYGSKENNAEEKFEELNPILTGIDEKFTPPLGHNHTLSGAGNAEVEMVQENVEAAKEHGEEFLPDVRFFASNCSQTEALYIDEKVESDKLGENVEAAETHREATELAVNAEDKTANLKSGKVGNNNSLMLSMSKFASRLVGLKTIKEQKEVTVHHTKEPEVVAQMVERPPSTPQRTEKLEKNVEEAGQCQATFDHAKGPESRVEKVLNTSQRTREQEGVVDEAGENLRIIQEDEVTEERENEMDAKGKHERKSEELEEMLEVEHLTMLRSERDNFLNGSCNLVGHETLEQEEMKISEDVSEWKENGQKHGKTHDEESRMRKKEAYLWFENKEQLKGALVEEINDCVPYVFPEIGEVEKKANEVLEPEIDNKKQNHARDGDEPKLPGELELSKVEERHTNTPEYDAAETTVMELKNCEVHNSAAFGDAEEANNTLRGAGISEENHNNCEFQEAAYEENIGEAVDVNSSDASVILDDAHANDNGTIFRKTQEPFDVDSNHKAEEYEEAVKGYKENDTVPEVTGTFSPIDKDKEADQLFRQEDNEIPGMDHLLRSASEEIFIESKLHNAFEGFLSDGKMENGGVMDADPEGKLPEDEDAFKTTSQIHDAAQEYAAKINRQNLTEVHPSDNRTTEIDLAYVRQVVEQTSESDEGSVSTSSVENIDGLAAHESEECIVNAKDNSNKEELKDEPEMVSNERKCAEEQSDGLHSQLHGETKEMEKSVEIEKAVERGVNMEKNEDNLVGTSPMEDKDAKESVQNFLTNDHQQRIEAITREREREKDRIAVERAIREARERAFAEARERAERAAVERAAAEVRQRAMAEAREKLEKPSVVKQPTDKASTEAKLRAERAAVERATSEARERALEKAMSQKTYKEARTQADRHPSDRFSSSSRNNGLKHSFSSSDLEKGTNTESAQRRKARLERHQRIMERAAKALEEKNMRDLLAQKEQAERNRLAESLDADIKRWATGKEGNLRALLSTLQYILGPDSGWRPISLTEIITTAAVKKAYRKATLYVHPDKLQQRGASIQQKYICEKVFDLLKAAWTRFNSEER